MAWVRVPLSSLSSALRAVLREFLFSFLFALTGLLQLGSGLLGASLRLNVYFSCNQPHLRIYAGDVLEQKHGFDGLDNLIDRYSRCI